MTTVGIASDPSITLTPSMADALGGGSPPGRNVVGGLRCRRGGRDGGLALMRGPDGLGAGVVDRAGGLGAGCAVLAAGTVTAVAIAGFALARAWVSAGR